MAKINKHFVINVITRYLLHYHRSSLSANKNFKFIIIIFHQHRLYFNPLRFNMKLSFQHETLHCRRGIRTYNYYNKTANKTKFDIYIRQYVEVI